jgi:large subunit GTPase 1
LNVEDGFHCNVLNLQSVTKENSIQDFFDTAELIQTDFKAQKLNLKFIDSKKHIKSFTNENHTAVELLQKRELLKIARRPSWSKTLTVAELQIQEKKEFSQWKKNLSSLEELNIVTPYEKNLELWRQLWRVIERSDIIVQIVDARNPLFFRCEDLEKYVKEVNPNKVNFIIINKADFLTQQQRKIWAKYFSEVGVHIAFFSAVLAVHEKDIECDQYTDFSLDESDIELLHYSDNKQSPYKIIKNSFNDLTIKTIKTFEINKNISNKKDDKTLNFIHISNKSKILNRKDLIELLKTIYIKPICSKAITIGLVGYPNVGKSSILNALIKGKNVSVSGTPGKTKHFQTLYLDKELILCDCPGLVMPSFVRTKAEMILNGILPINQMKDHVPSINLLGTLIPRQIIEKLYGIIIPLSIQDTQLPTAEEILNAHGRMIYFLKYNYSIYLKLSNENN